VRECVFVCMSLCDYVCVSGFMNVCEYVFAYMHDCDSTCMSVFICVMCVSLYMCVFAHKH
jgi:hypothetical protein